MIATIQLVIDMRKDRKYYKRIADKVLELKLRAFGATNIVGLNGAERPKQHYKKLKVQ